MEGYEKLNEMIFVLQTFQDSNPEYAGDQPVSARDVLNMVNQDPRNLQQMLDYVKEQSGDLVGVDITPNFVADLADDWNLLPSDIQLLHLDYSAIVDYFDRTKTYAQLTVRQQRYLESLRYTDDDFTVDGGMGFKTTGDAVNGLNVKEQLVGRLISDGYLSHSMLEEIEQIEQSFGEGAQTWNYRFVDQNLVQPESGGEIELQEWTKEAENLLETGDLDDGDLDAMGDMLLYFSDDLAPYGRMWMFEDPILLQNFAEDTFRAHYDPDLYNTISNTEQNQHMFMKSQNFEGSWSDFLESNNMVDEQFAPLWDIWDNTTFEDIWGTKDHVGEDPFLQEPPADALEYKPPDAGEIEMTNYKIIPEEEIIDPHMSMVTPIDDDDIIAGDLIIDPNLNKITPFGDDGPPDYGIVEARAALNEIPNVSDFIAVGKGGSTWFNKGWFSRWAQKQEASISNFPFIFGLNEWMGAIDPSHQLNDWVNLSLAGIDFALTQDPVGLAVMGLTKLAQEIDFDDKRKIDNDNPYAERGSY